MQTSLYSIRKPIMAAVVCLLLSAMAGCGNDDVLSDTGGANTEQPTEGEKLVPITIALGGYGENEQAAGFTRVAPPGAGSESSGTDDGIAETSSIDVVRVIAFRRREQMVEDEPDNSKAEGTETNPFEYDPNNRIELTTFTEEDRNDIFYPFSPHKHRVAKGQFAMSPGFEYRIVAIAYKKNEKWPYPYYGSNIAMSDDMLNLKPGTKYSEFCATFTALLNPEKKTDDTNCWAAYLRVTGLTHYSYSPTNGKHLSRRLTVIPQLFYGTIYTKGDVTMNPVFSHSKYVGEGENKTSLVGTLYRGMAEVEVNIKNVKKDKATPQWYCLLADNVLTKVSLTSYDDFKKGSEPVSRYSNTGTYTAVAYHDAKSESLGSMIKLKAYLLPAKTHIAVRVGYDDNTPYVVNGQVKAQDVVSAGGATGVVEVDALDDVFYLKRNHKYVLTYDDETGKLFDRDHLLN